MDQSRNFADILRRRSAQDGDRLAFAFLDNHGFGKQTLTFSELDRRARVIAGFLQARGNKQDRVLLLFPPGLEYVTAFMGCLYAGMIAVSLYPPRHNRKFERAAGVITDCGPNIALTGAAVYPVIVEMFRSDAVFSGIRLHVTDTLPDDSAGAWRDPGVTREDLAFLQYTSGSTGSPKGVMISHGNLIANEAALAEALQSTPDDIGLNWLPLYHDMGLVGTVLHAIYSGFLSVLMSPLSFVRSPVGWLEAITRYRATICGGPHFGYEMCLQRITPEKLAQLDLSSWRVAYDGAEPLRASGLKRFSRMFAPAGFNPNAFYPCYGMAEATVFVAGMGLVRAPKCLTIDRASLKEGFAKLVPEGDKRGVTLVSCGNTVSGHNLLVVNPVTRVPAPSGTVGEIWVQGPSVAGGYWSKGTDNDAVFRARTAPEGNGPYLRSSDVGFLYQNELYVTGRLTDMIIIRGLNYYPQDIEQQVERANEAFIPNACAAFTVEGETGPLLVVAQEVGRRHCRDANLEPFVLSARAAVAAAYGLRIDTMVLMRPGGVLKTTSGKIRRSACRDAFLRGTLDALEVNVLPDRMEREREREVISREQLGQLDQDDRVPLLVDYLRGILAGALHCSPEDLDPHQPTHYWGLDSLTDGALRYRVEADLNVSPPMPAFAGNQTIHELAVHLSELHEASQRAAEGVRGKLDDKDRAFRLSRNQFGIWLQNRIAPESGAEHLVFAAKIRSELNVAALRCAVDAMVDQHPALRTAYGARGKRIVQWVHEKRPADFVEVDARGWPRAYLDDHMTEMAKMPFDLERDSLLRLRLYYRGSKKTVLLFVAHGISLDLHGLGILIDGLGPYYASFRARRKKPDGGPETTSAAARQLVREASPGPARDSYRDFVVWQEARLAPGRGNLPRAFWRRELNDDLPVVALPVDRPAPPARSFAGASRSFEIFEPLSGRLEQLARNRGATLYTLLLAAFQALLFRYTGQEELVVSSPAGGRTMARWQQVIGNFANVLPLRSQPCADLPFDVFLARVRETVVAALAHQDYPFPHLADKVETSEEEVSPAPFQRVGFAFLNHPDFPRLGALASRAPGVRIVLGGLELESMQVEPGTSLFDLSLSIAMMRGALRAMIDYSTELFDGVTIGRFALHYKHLLEDIVSRPHKPLGALTIIGDAEQHTLLANWNHTQRFQLSGMAIHDVFELLALQYPDTVSLVYGEPNSELDARSLNRQMTYAVLNTLSTRLAHHLIAMGVGPETLVAVCLPESEWVVVAVLAVLKAGAVYLSLDPRDPSERSVYVMEDAGAALVLTQRTSAENLTGGSARRLYLEDIDLERDSRGDDTLPTVDGASAACVLYTLGLSGRLAGIVLEHGHITNLFRATRRHFGFGRDDVRALLHPFDTRYCAWEVWGSLCRGGRLVIPPLELINEAREVMHLVAAQGVTMLSQTASGFREMLSVLFSKRGRSLGASLRMVVLSGGVPGRDDLQAWFEADEGEMPRLVQMHGAPETVVLDVFHGRGRDVPVEDDGLMVGALTGVRCYVMDPYLHLTPIGVPGVLCVGGGGLARGYLDRPDLTASSFVPDPFSDEPGARLFISGESARFRNDGKLVFHPWSEDWGAVGGSHFA